MPLVTFTGDPRAPGTDPAILEHRGHIFPLGEAVDVPASVAARLAGHSHFTVGASVEPPADELIARHRGRGSYSIMRGDEELVQGLSKDEAAAFNDLSNDDKRAFVQ